MRCIAVCTARQYQLREIANRSRTLGFTTHFHHNVLQIILSDHHSDVFVFQDGCFVYWGPRPRQAQKLLDELKPYSESPLDTIETDDFVVRQGEVVSIQPIERFNVDLITLDSEQALSKLAISYAIAQSVKLQSFETEIMQTIRINSALPTELSKHGKISLSRKNLAKRMGDIFIARSNVNLHSEFLSVPKYFWHYPGIEGYYVDTADFLDIETRARSLNKKLDALQEVLDILTAELQYRQASILELVIIILIMVEIILTLMQWH